MRGPTWTNWVATAVTLSCFLVSSRPTLAWSPTRTQPLTGAAPKPSTQSSSSSRSTTADSSVDPLTLCPRRNFLTSTFGTSLWGVVCCVSSGTLLPPQAAQAYTPDEDKLRESLYMISRVQEATAQQERFVNKATRQEDLKAKLTLTLKLVEKNYRLLDQINLASAFTDPKDDLVTASEAGYEAVDALQGAIDFVKTELGQGDLAETQRLFLTTSMQSCRENLFVFLKYMPQDKLEGARKRVEEENVLNRDEFDGDADASVYNPVVLPWKEQARQDKT